MCITDVLSQIGEGMGCWEVWGRDAAYFGHVEKTVIEKTKDVHCLTIDESSTPVALHE